VTAVEWSTYRNWEAGQNSEGGLGPEGLEEGLETVLAILMRLEPGEYVVERGSSERVRLLQKASADLIPQEQHQLEEWMVLHDWPVCVPLWPSSSDQIPYSFAPDQKHRGRRKNARFGSKG
jgi:hypothetical protein